MVKTSKRDEIVRAALELIAKHGFHGTSMAMIAEHAKVAAGTIYCYFQSKDELIIELFKEAESNMYAALTSKPAEHFSIHERYLYLCNTLFHYFIDNQNDYKYLEQFFNSPYGVEYRRNIEDQGNCNIFINMFLEGQSQKVIKDLPLVILFALSFGPIMNLTRDHILGFFTLNDVVISQTIEACWDAVKQQ